MLGTIKIYIGGNINWLIQIMLLLAATATSLAASHFSTGQTLQGRLSRLGDYKPMLFGWLLFMAGIAAASLVNHSLGFYTLAKYLAFMLILAMLVVISPLTPKLLEKSLSAALIVSLIPLILLALFRQTDAMVILGDGRMGWLASWPGVIWKAGAFVWPFAVWRCLKQPHMRNLLLAFSAVLVMALDGSRTAILWIILVWGGLAAIVFACKVHAKPVRSHLGLLLLTILSFSIIQPALLNWVSGHYDLLISKPLYKTEGNINDIPSLVDESTANRLVSGDIPSLVDESTANRLVSGDNTIRLGMLRVSWQHAVESFPWGGGFGSTRLMDFGANSVIHMTYLQLLADDGVLAFVGYLLFLLYPLYRGVRYVISERKLFIERFDTMLCPLSALTLFLFMGLFHPLSNELTEWGIILAALAIVITHVSRRQ
ncbi:hypothetical protein [Yersinia intermedia]|uniref:hypothetical protein n=1 Tax=Yersinia intermedia TaxID=631 RepID=UPI00384CAA2D